MSLLDIVAPKPETVSAGGASFEISGLTPATLFPIAKRFPALATTLAQGSIDVPAMMGLGSEIIGAIVAAAAGHAAEPEYEDAAARMSFEDAAEVLGVIARLTLPNGWAPLVGKLTANLVSLLGEEGAENGTGS